MKSILFDCERMKYPNTGPYHVCEQVGRHLLTQKSEDERLTFLVPPRLDGFFGPNAGYYKLRPINKLYLPWYHSRYLASTDQFDVWHITYQSSMYVPLHKKTKVVLTILDLNFLHDHPNRAKNKKYLSLIQKRVDRADAITCISDFALNDVRQHLDLRGKPATTVYIGCDFEKPRLVQPPVHVPRRPFLFALGTVLPKKNFHVLPCLLQHDDVELIIAGIDTSAYKEEIMREAKKFNVQDRVTFVGAVSEPEKNWYYQQCEAFLFPSIAEGFGLPVVEAMTFGKPVFLSTHTSLPEVGGQLACYFADFSPESMRQTFAEGMAQFRRDHPEEAIKAWARRFDWANTAKDYLALYRSLY